MKLLLVEDNLDLADNVIDYLGMQGIEVDFAANGVRGLQKATSETYDALILDLNLPGVDGLELCRHLRSTSERHIPILMITARSGLDDTLAGFEAGTDDYLTKPFALEELLARVRAIVRRHAPKTPAAAPVLQIADLSFDTGTVSVARGGQPIHLGASGYKILGALMEASPNMVARADLHTLLWGDWQPGSDVLRTHIYELRQAIDKPFETALIRTVRGQGYRLVAPGIDED